MTAMFDPFTPSNGNSASWSAARGSVVGCPSGPSAHPSGIVSPLLAASRTLTHAVSLAASSNTRRPSRVGVGEREKIRTRRSVTPTPNTLISAGSSRTPGADETVVCEPCRIGGQPPAGKQFVTLSAATPQSRAASMSVLAGSSRQRAVRCRGRRRPRAPHAAVDGREDRRRRAAGPAAAHRGSRADRATPRSGFPRCSAVTVACARPSAITGEPPAAQTASRHRAAPAATRRNGGRVEMSLFTRLAEQPALSCSPARRPGNPSGVLHRWHPPSGSGLRASDRLGRCGGPTSPRERHRRARGVRSARSPGSGAEPFAGPPCRTSSPAARW